ncbi:MAG TPA: PilC/PilY family type IV pilus protein [Ideonella sp.]|uniref:pilus assembly protein n=1 Tax=Ideonella sp. TaxID=1929293 RepID=UPI002C9BBB49|nr:PilC/PilY family type IV pilus protein [Ideonella sp.]HSI49255.1 PilC/PilY family type IV pilus protein [Ideonella sp.]
MTSKINLLRWQSDVGLNIVRAVALLLAGGVAAAAWAVTNEPSQTPLTSRVGDAPPPNVMITLDDSGSMNSDFMPVGAVLVNNVTTRLDSTKVGDHLGAFLDDPRKKAVNQLDGYIPALKVPIKVSGKTYSPDKYQMQFRSPDVNTIWYNPEVRYRPWLKATPKSDGTGEYMANATPAAAYWDPIKAATLNPATFDLTTNKTAESRAWCLSYDTTCVTVKLDYYPGLFYRLKSGAPADDVGNYTLYDVNDASNYSSTRTSKPTGRTDCVTLSNACTQDEEKQNFANWFTYHRMREALAKGALTESLFGFQDKMRVGWGRINSGSTKIDGINYNVIRAPLRNLDKTQLQTVLSGDGTAGTGIQNISSSGGTPLRTALDAVGPYFTNRRNANGTPQAGNPWLTTIGDATSTQLACRRSINLLTTDGYYNDTNYKDGGEQTNMDGNATGSVIVVNGVTIQKSGVNGFDYTGANNPNGYTPTHYVAQRPYIDDPKNVATNSLTDVAMKWYFRDLDTGIPNKVVPADTDIAFWQHLTQFTIGIGVKGTLDSSSPDRKAATLADIASGAKVWPLPDKGDPQKIDDLWHAAVNTGGDFYPVKNGTELSAALTNVFSRAVGVESREAGVATVASTLSASNIKFVPQYKSGAWYGEVFAYQLDDTGDVLKDSKPIWQASTKLPSAAARKLFTWGETSGQEFKVGTLSTADVNLIGSADLVNYIRGETANEGNSLSFRPRGGQFIGDIINSPPVYVRDLLDSSYGSLSDPAEAGSYAEYLAAKKARTDGALAVGANAGVFHVFRGSTGVETFGFVPRAGFSNLNLIASKTYGTASNSHRFFVDGPTVEADAYITPKGGSKRWTNMLVGSMGAGGKSVFALNLPTADPAQLNADSVQWELNDHADLGYVMNDMRTGKIQNGGGWYAFVGNGPYSANGNAALLVVDLETGAVVKSLVVSPNTGANGLGGVRLLRNSHLEVYAAYAGDLQGNLWRFDFGRGDDISTWKVGFNNSPLFKATDSAGKAQPIVDAPAAIPHPTKGFVVNFGTGRLIDVADSANIDAQTFYGVWDDTPAEGSSAALASPFASANPNRSLLVAQSIDSTTNIEGVTYYTVSSNAVNWTSKKGWYLETHIQDGQRTIYPAQNILNFVYISTIVPAAKAAECEFASGAGYNFVLDGVSGAAINGPVFDTNGDGTVDNSDATVAGAKTLADGQDKLLTNQTGLVNEYSTNRCLPDLNAKCPADSCLVVIVNTTNDAQELCVPGPHCSWDNPMGDPRCLCPDGVTQKKSATDNCQPLVPVVTDRVWRQIMNPPQPVAPSP